MRLTFVLFSMSQVRSAKRVCKERGRKAYYLTKSRNDLPTREWMYRDGAARKVLGECDFVFDDDLNRDNLLKIAVTADELREVNVYEVCVQPLDGDEFTVHVDVAACRISDLKSQICAKNGMCPSEQLLYLMSSSSGSVSPKPLFDGKDFIVSDCKVSLHHSRKFCCCTLRFILKLNSASAAFTFGRGGILSENRKDGKVTVHSAKNTTKFDSTVGPYANSADQINLGVAAALRSNIYGGVPRASDRAYKFALCTVANSGDGGRRKKSGASPKRLSKEDRQAQQRKVASAGAYNTRLSLAFYSVCVRVCATCRRKVVVLCLLCLFDIDTETKVE